ncbi:TPA: hypothetical protein N2D16_002887 [Clostridium botulinum]|nr:hypothetical protein [Clostridium botulinum]HCL4455267.1 hypothetical protein [Clostridium botulinum]
MEINYRGYIFDSSKEDDIKNIKEKILVCEMFDSLYTRLEEYSHDFIIKNKHNINLAKYLLKVINTYYNYLNKNYNISYIQNELIEYAY